MHTIEDEARGDTIFASQNMGSMVSQTEIRKIGKVYAPDANLNDVVMSEMARIH